MIPLSSVLRALNRGLLALAAALAAVSAAAHTDAPTPRETDPGRRIVFPDTAEGMTLVVDLHTHSVFSDGHVWPSVRVGEAIADGLDAVAITEHLEWQPHLDDIPHRFTFRVLNALVAPDQHPEVAFSVAIAEAAPGPG
jgi:hypothetical protein